MRKALSVFALLAASLAWTPSAQAHHAPGPIRIAAVLTLSGQAGFLGAAELKGLQLAVEQVNRRGGLLSHSFELTHEDDGGDPGKAAEIARRLATPETADLIIGGSTVPTSLAVAAVAERARIPFIALGASSSITPASRRWVFQTAPTELHAVPRVLADMNKRGFKRIGLIAEAGESGEPARHEVRDLTHPQGLGVRKYGIRLGLDLAYPAGGQNVRALLAPVPAASDLDALFVYGAGEGAAAVTRELRGLGVKLPVYHSHGAAAQEFLKLAGEAAEGVRMPSPPVLVAGLLPGSDPRKAVLAEFVAAFTARFGEAPSSFAGYAYDALNLCIEAIRRAMSLDFETMRRAIELTQGFAGVTGTYRMWLDNHTGVDEKALMMLEVKDGAFRIAD